MGFRNAGKHVQEYVYDFAVDGGAQGAINLSAKDGYSPLPSGAIVEKVSLKVITACTSGGSATVAAGNTTDPNGYIVDIAVATLADEYVANHAMSAGALLWDNTNDNDIPFLVNSDNDAVFSVTIATADLTAGKIVYWVEYYMPSED